METEELELLIRPSKLKVFISSKMSDRSLHHERMEVAKAIDTTDYAEPWFWERNAIAGTLCSEDLCVGQAKSSDALVLIVGDELTRVTIKEFEAARDFGVPCFVLIHSAFHRKPETDKFVREVRAYAVTTSFGNLSELATQVVDALRNLVTFAVRRDNVRRRKANGARVAQADPYVEVHR